LVDERDRRRQPIGAGVSAHDTGVNGGEFAEPGLDLSRRGETGEGSVHGPGTFLHLAAGTSHTPSTDTDGELFVYYPEG
jgi:hypothetical protein